MLGASINEHKTHFVTQENNFFKCCTDSLDSLWNTADARPLIEAKLRRIRVSMNTEHILRCNVANVKALKEEGFSCTYWYGKPPPNPRATPVFTPPSTQTVAPHMFRSFDLDNALEHFEVSEEAGAEEDDGDARVYNSYVD